jgi:23S rRNA pseudouridine1911/1915/1917 synthase
LNAPRPRTPARGPTRERLDVVLIRAYEELSRRKAREVVEKGQVSVNGAVVLEPGELVSPAATVVWDVNRPARRRARLSLPRLYEDEHVLIVDKPAGLLSVPTSPEAADEEDTALARVTEYMHHLRPAQPFVGTVHRIDRGTSGAVAFALDARARSALRALFRAHRIERVYLALVEGAPTAQAGMIDAPIHDRYASGRRRVARPDEASKPAVTRWRVLETMAGATLLEIQLETGRQHQIRIHLSHAGLPILGDETYRPDDTRRRVRLAVRRPMLHARVLAFDHPLTGTRVRAESPLPQDFQRVLRQLRARK